MSEISAAIINDAASRRQGSAPKSPPHEHDFQFGFVFRFVSGLISIAFSSFVAIIACAINNWSPNDFIFVIYGGLIFSLTLMSEYIRTGILEIAQEQFINERLSENIQYDIVDNDTFLPKNKNIFFFDEYNTISKRVFDILVAISILIVLMPLLFISWAAIKLDSKGPIIFKQRRVGLNGQEFAIYKFRTMTVMDDGEFIVQAKRGDARVTRVGRFLRRTSLDELPQLFNVLKGEMSLVGPRPLAIAHDEAYAHIADYNYRRLVRPGITGWSVANGNVGPTASVAEMQKRVELDIWYVNNRSLWLDARILLKTVWLLMTTSGY